jgi:hypothetical protein
MISALNYHNRYREAINEYDECVLKEFQVEQLRDGTRETILSRRLNGQVHKQR